MINFSIFRRIKATGGLKKRRLTRFIVYPLHNSAAKAHLAAVEHGVLSRAGGALRLLAFYPHPAVFRDKRLGGLQGLAELHCYLKTVHQFDAAEVEALLQFADPLEAANLCWEENPHAYRFPICELLRETGAKERLPPAGPEPPRKLSVREQLRTAMREARQQPAPEERPKGDESR